MKVKDELETYESLIDFYKREIYGYCLIYGGYAKLSELLGREVSYISKNLTRGKVNILRDIYLKLKKIHEVK